MNPKSKTLSFPYPQTPTSQTLNIRRRTRSKSLNLSLTGDSRNFSFTGDSSKPLLNPDSSATNSICDVSRWIWFKALSNFIFVVSAGLGLQIPAETIQDVHLLACINHPRQDLKVCWWGFGVKRRLPGSFGDARSSFLLGFGLPLEFRRLSRCDCSFSNFFLLLCFFLSLKSLIYFVCSSGCVSFDVIPIPFYFELLTLVSFCLCVWIWEDLPLNLIFSSFICVGGKNSVNNPPRARTFIFICYLWNPLSLTYLNNEMWLLLCDFVDWFVQEFFFLWFQFCSLVLCFVFLFLENNNYFSQYNFCCLWVCIWDDLPLILISFSFTFVGGTNFVNYHSLAKTLDFNLKSWNHLSLTYSNFEMCLMIGNILDWIEFELRLLWFQYCSLYICFVILFNGKHYSNSQNNDLEHLNLEQASHCFSDWDYRMLLDSEQSNKQNHFYLNRQYMTLISWKFGHLISSLCRNKANSNWPFQLLDEKAYRTTNGVHIFKKEIKTNFCNEKRSNRRNQYMKPYPPEQSLLEP